MAKARPYLIFVFWRNNIVRCWMKSATSYLKVAKSKRLYKPSRRGSQWRAAVFVAVDHLKLPRAETSGTQ